MINVNEEYIFEENQYYLGILTKPILCFAYIYTSVLNFSVLTTEIKVEGELRYISLSNPCRWQLEDIILNSNLLVDFIGRCVVWILDTTLGVASLPGKVNEAECNYSSVIWK